VTVWAGGRRVRGASMMDRLRVGVIGASPNGSWGSVAHLPALTALRQFEVTAVSTAHLETAGETAKRFSVPHVFADPRALAEHPQVDVVAVAVRVPAHQELVSIALGAGKHVYCEWPLARSTDEAETLHAAAQAAGVVHMVGLQARRSPAIEYARDLVVAGEIGAVKAAQLTHSVPWSFGGRASSGYLLDRDSGAHFLSIPGGHSIDVLCWLLGEFSSLTATLERVGNGIDATDSVRPSHDQVTIGGMLRGGAAVGVRLQGSSRHGTGVRLEIGGTAGDLILSSVPGGRGIQMSDLTLARSTDTGRLIDLEIPAAYCDLPPAIRSNPAANVAKAYLAMHAAITAGAAPSSDFGDAVVRHRTLDAVVTSSDEGRRLVLGP